MKSSITFALNPVVITFYILIVIFISSTIRAQTADIVLLDGRIWTASPDIPEVQALAIKANKIVDMGSNGEMGKYTGENTEIIKLNGKRVLPGFIDSHTHFIDGALQLQRVNLRAAFSKEEFIKLISEKAGSLPEGEWILGGDWDHQQWPGKELPRKEWIDSVTANTPVFVNRHDGHMALANSLTLKLAGITRDTPLPSGGKILKDPDTNELTGILKDSAMDLVQKIIPETSQNKKLQALYEALKLANSYGVTGIHDISTFDDLDLYRIASEENRLTLRVYSITPLPLLDELLNRIKIRGKSQPFLHIGGVKGFVDGSLGSSTALFFEPYTDDPLNYGLLNSMMYPEGNMRRMILKADRAGIQAAVHAIGDKANNILLNIYEGIIEEEGERDRRFRIEHAQHLLPDDIPRFSRLGVIASMQPYHAIDDGRWAESRIGHRRSTTTYAFRSLLDNGALLSFGSDWSVAPLNPLTGIYAAVTRATTDGKSPGGWIPEEKITVEEALKAYTINAAYAEFAEHIKGSLEPGKLADIIILSEDIFDMAPERIPEIKVLMTIVNGKIVFRSEEFK